MVYIKKEKKNTEKNNIRSNYNSQFICDILQQISTWRNYYTSV